MKYRRNDVPTVGAKLFKPIQDKRNILGQGVGIATVTDVRYTPKRKQLRIFLHCDNYTCYGRENFWVTDASGFFSTEQECLKHIAINVLRNRQNPLFAIPESDESIVETARAALALYDSVQSGGEEC